MNAKTPGIDRSRSVQDPGADGLDGVFGVATGKRRPSAWLVLPKDCRLTLGVRPARP